MVVRVGSARILGGWLILDVSKGTKVIPLPNPVKLVKDLCQPRCRERQRMEGGNKREWVGVGVTH